MLRKRFSVERINFTNLDVAVMAKLADTDGMEPEDAADKWLKDNEARWQAWVENAGSSRSRLSPLAH